MGRLIDADKLLKIVDKNYDGFAKTFTRTIINDQPTAYDADKIAKQIGECMDCTSMAPCAIKCCANHYLSKAIELVKGGGQGE